MQARATNTASDVLPGVSAESDVEKLARVFQSVFGVAWNTELIGGADEPLYMPGEEGKSHRIYFRYDYFSSALHEISHWCLAGEQRREQIDYGYWYEPDGRNTEQQWLFERVEAKPQALEWLFTKACGKGFQVSIDNLDGEPVDTFPFRLAVWQALNKNGQPTNFLFGERAALFISALQEAFDVTPWGDLTDFCLSQLER